jgi:hypothetical protein
MRPKVTRRSGVVAAVWAALVGGALIVTLNSLRTDGFDGLNNMFQIPLALELTRDLGHGLLTCQAAREAA